MAKDSKERILTAAPEVFPHLFACTTPIFALIHLCDRDPEKTEDAIRKIEAFSRHFTATCGVKYRSHVPMNWEPSIPGSRLLRLEDYSCIQLKKVRRSV